MKLSLLGVNRLGVWVVTFTSVSGCGEGEGLGAEAVTACSVDLCATRPTISSLQPKRSSEEWLTGWGSGKLSWKTDMPAQNLSKGSHRMWGDIYKQLSLKHLFDRSQSSSHLVLALTRKKCQDIKSLFSYRSTNIQSNYHDTRICFNTSISNNQYFFQHYGIF